VALIVVVLCLTPVARPWPLIVANPLLEESQRTKAVTSLVPSARAVNCWESGMGLTEPGCVIKAWEGLTAIETSPTFSVVVPIMEPKVAVMVVVPWLTPVACPLVRPGHQPCSTRLSGRHPNLFRPAMTLTRMSQDRSEPRRQQRRKRSYDDFSSPPLSIALAPFPSAKDQQLESLTLRQEVQDHK
jgi:hypothetical protein